MKLRNILVISTLVAIIAIFALSYLGIFKVGFINVRAYVSFLPLVVALAAILDSINPCAFSVLFITIAFLFSLGHGRMHILKSGLAYVGGIYLTYILIGLGILKVLTVFNIPNIAAKVGAIFIILAGLINLINEFYPKFPIKLKIPEISKGKTAELISKASIPAAFLLGVLVGMFEFPCTGGPYLMVLGLLHDQTTYYIGFIYLIFYNLVFVLPLLLIIFLATNKAVLDKVNNVRKMETKKAKVWVSLILIFLGLLVFIL